MCEYALLSLCNNNYDIAVSGISGNMIVLPIHLNVCVSPCGTLLTMAIGKALYVHPKTANKDIGGI